MRIMFIMVFLWSCGAKSQNTTNQAKELMAYCDNLFDSNISQIYTYVVIDRERPPVKVVDIDKWADKKYESFINVIKKEGVKVAYIESPYSESGDWNNVYSYYYNLEGTLIAFRRSSNFYNSVCVDGALTEIRTDFYDKGDISFSVEELMDNEGNVVIDDSSCEFNYRFEVPMYYEAKKIPFFSTL